MKIFTHSLFECVRDVMESWILYGCEVILLTQRSIFN